ncbi:DUF92 domain-containing protein [Metabacillus fastidiosus]|uniref:DUF92 domain-containing protein n=1 Tax=Metabacillus fastidiosus TaxID=1458 RepID=UPI003D2D2B4A
MFDILALLLLFLASLLGWRWRTLSLSGAVAAFIVGSIIYIGFSVKGLILLAVFFVSSSFFSKYKKEEKVSLNEIVAKGDRRDWLQVLANAGVPSLTSLLFVLTKDPVYILAFGTSIAAANSDTWASEIGVLSKSKPFMLLTLKRVEKGTSGAVSLLGTFAALGGAAIIAVSAWFLLPISFHEMIFILLFGFLGNIIDTILGNSFQNKYECTSCSKITERKVHCGSTGKKISRYSFLNNDFVNLLSIILATIGILAIS